LGAVPLLTLAVILRVSSQAPDRSSTPPTRQLPLTRMTPIDLENGTYLGKLNRICDKATRLGAIAPESIKSASSLPASLPRFDLYGPAIIHELRAVKPPPWFKRWHMQLVRFNVRQLAAQLEAERALARHQPAAEQAAVQRAYTLSQASDRLSAAIGLVYCLTPAGSDPHLAYPRAPVRAGRTLLSWPDYDRAIDGICADNSARTVYGQRLAADFKPFTRRERNTGLWRLDDSAFQRLYALVRRLGGPPDDRRPAFAAWLERVRERALVMHQERVAAFEQNPARASRLDRVFHRLSAEENWLGRRLGLRVCSSNGLARAPA